MEIDLRYDFTGKTILVVEDDTVSRIYFRELLAPTGALIDFVRNGNETLEYFQTNRVPFVVLMDIKLPDINGIELSKILIGKHPGIKIVAQTAFANPEIEYLCKEAGMVAYITKPIRNDELMIVLNNILKD